MIFGNKFVWWTGVVEDRNDPEKLGRCRVRIFGFHTDDIILLPTSDLPWALPLQSITSAATSGLGQTPVGIVPGTWVVGWFLDGEEAQRPLIIGTLAGIPEKQPEAIKKETQDAGKNTSNIFRSSDGSPVVDQDNNPITTKGAVARESALYPLISDDLTNIFSTIAEKASGNDITKESMDGRLGKYQLSVATLVLLGYVKRPASNFDPKGWTDKNSNWTGKDGISSKVSYLKSESAQYNTVLATAEYNYKQLLSLGKISQQDDPKIIGALLGTSLVMGVNNSDKLNKKTENGVLAKDFFMAVNSSLGGSSDDFAAGIDNTLTYLADPANNDLGILNNSELLKRRGFTDPNKKYPTYEYLGLSDVNKLALGDMTHQLFNVKVNKKVEKIPLPNTTQTWDEPNPSFGAAYPYNQVIETEAGHVIELDSTPNAERIHVFHKSGAYIEIDVNGSMVRKVVGDNYEIMDRNNFTYVRGSHCLTVEGKMSMLVRNSAQIVVEGDLSVTAHKDTSISTAGTATIVGKNINVSSVESMNLITDGALNLQGKNINLYAKDGSISQKAGEDISIQTGAASTMSIKAGQALLLDAAIVKTKMGADSIREIAFSSLPLPEMKETPAAPPSILQRNVVPESTFLYDSLELGAAEFAKMEEEQDSINTNVVPVEIPVVMATETIPADIIKTVSTFGDGGIVNSTVTTSNTITNANVTTSVVTNTNEMDVSTSVAEVLAEINRATNEVITKTANTIGEVVYTTEILAANTATAVVTTTKAVANTVVKTAKVVKKAVANTTAKVVTATNETGTKISTLTADTIETNVKNIDSVLATIKSYLPTSKW